MKWTDFAFWCVLLLLLGQQIGHLLFNHGWRFP